MANPHASADLEKLLRFSRFRCRRPDPERLSGAPEQRGVPYWVGSREEHQTLGRLGEGADACQIVVLDPARNILRLANRKATCQLCCANALRQFQQGKRVAPRLRDDPFSDPLIQSAWDDGRQQGPRIRSFQPSEHQLRQASKLAFAARLAHPENDRDRLRQQPSGHKPEDLAGGAGEPLRTIHKTRERPLYRYLGEQAQDSQRNEEGIWNIAGREAEGDPQSALLWLRKTIELVNHRPAQLMERGERQLHLGFDAGNVGDSKAGSLLSRVAKQGCLSDAALTTDDEDRALPPTHVLQ